MAQGGKSNFAFSSDETSLTDINSEQDIRGSYRPHIPLRKSPERPKYENRENKNLEEDTSGRKVKEDRKKTTDDQCNSTWLRFVGGAAFVLALAAGIVLLIVFLIEPYVEKPVPFYGCKLVTAKPGFRREAEIECHFKPDNITLRADKLVIKFHTSVVFPDDNTPDVRIPLKNLPLNESINITDAWNVILRKSEDKLTKDDIWLLNLYMKPLHCDSVGRYDFIIENSQGKERVKYTLNVFIHSEVSPVNMAIRKIYETNSAENISHYSYVITCSSTSDCTSHQIVLDAITKNRTQFPTGTSFACTTSYTHRDGQSVQCFGSIAESVVSTYDALACQPREYMTGVHLDTKDKEGIIPISSFCLSKDCAFICPNTTTKSIYIDAKSCGVYHVCDNQNMVTQSCQVGLQFNNITCNCELMRNQTLCDESMKWKQPFSQITNICSVINTYITSWLCQHARMNFSPTHLPDIQYVPLTSGPWIHRHKTLHYGEAAPK